MKSALMILVSLVLSLPGITGAQQSPDADRLVARIMGDLMFLQTNPDKKSRQAVEARLDDLEEEMVKTGQTSDTSLMRMVEAISRALHYLNDANILGNDEMQKLLSSYENFFQRYSLRERPDPAFLVLDLRFRYLARTAVSPYGLMTVPPLRLGIEDVLEGAGTAVSSEARRQKSMALQRDWDFLKNLVGQYNSQPVPRMVDYISLRMCQRHLGVL